MLFHHRVSLFLGDWRGLPPGKRKYALYLKSPEWTAIRAAVRARSGGWCEQCRWRRAREVHHETYHNVYAERLDDLKHLCRACHESEHSIVNWRARMRLLLLAVLLLIAAALFLAALL